MRRLPPVSFSIAAGIILWLSWPVSPFTAFVFFGFVPLMLVADIEQRRSRFFIHAFLAMLTWNAGSTWWIWNSTDVGSIAAIVANSLLMCLPWWGYQVFHQRYGKWQGYLALLCFWMAFEFIHLNWQLSWPWLNLGNVFAMQPDWVQWYEVTGIGGGSLWILAGNILVYDWLFNSTGKTRNLKFKKATLAAVVLLLPVAISWIIVSGQPEKAAAPHNVVIVQPNIDPYGKFNPASVAEQVRTHVQLTESAIDSSTKLVIWPETALSANAEIGSLEQVPDYRPVFELLSRRPDLTLLSGVETYRLYGTEKPESRYARKTSDGIYYDAYNAAVTLKAGQQPAFYVKSKLVPGVETLPSFLDFMGPVFEQFGGTTGGYAMDTASVAFHTPGNPYVTAPIICYESIYGEYIGSYVQKGANILTIMTNDGWWGNTPGHRQHLHYARLRAIETRRWIARSANTGISAVIDDYGNILETKAWDTAAAIRYALPEKQELTFYAKNGDYLYRFFALLAGLLVLLRVVTALRSRWKQRG